MARQQMIEVKCDRCKRVEYVKAIKNKGTVESTLDLKFRLSGKSDKTTELKFDDLCSPCEKTVKNLVESIAKEIKGKSPSRNSETKEDGGDDTPSISTSDIPTQPHAAS